MKIYVTDIGDDSVGIQEFTIATLDIHESMVDVLENENEMDNFKKEFMALIEKYCQPEVAYDVYSDKDIEEEAKAEEEMMIKYCAGDVIATMEMYKNKPNIQTLTGECEHPSNDNEPLMIVPIGEGDKLFLYRIKGSFVGGEDCYQVLKNNEELVKVFNDYSTSRKFMLGQERR